MPKYFEQVIWALALISIYFMDTSSLERSICVFKFFGFTSCPGCGLGHAVYNVLHFNLARSFEHHIFGLPVTLALLIQIFRPIVKQSKIKLT